MCVTWNDQQWKENSQPVKSDSRYTLIDTRYSQSGETAHTYQEINGWVWGVRPGLGEYDRFTASRYADPHAAALEYLANYGFNLTEKPLDGVEADAPVLRLGDLVENFA